MPNNDPYMNDHGARRGCVSEDGNMQRPPEKKRRRRGGKVRLMLLVLFLLLVLLLMLSMGGMGFGGGFGQVGVVVQSGVTSLTEAAREAVNQAAPAPEATPALAAVAATPEAPDPNRIVVRQDTVEYMGQTLTLAQLRDALLQNYQEGEVTLVDEQAIKAAYDGVTGLLSELAIPYTVS